MPAGAGGRNTNRAGGSSPGQGKPQRFAGGGGGSAEPPVGGYQSGGGFEFSGGGKTTGDAGMDKGANFVSKFFDPGGILFDDDWGMTSAEDAAAQLAREMKFWGDVYGEERGNVDHNAEAKMRNMMAGLNPYQEALGTVWGEKAPNLDFSGMFENDFKRVDVDAMRQPPPGPAPGPEGPKAPRGALLEGLGGPGGGFAGRMGRRLRGEGGPNHIETSGEGAPPPQEESAPPAPAPKRPRSVGRGGRGGSSGDAAITGRLRGG